MTSFGLIRSPRNILFGAGQRGALGTLARSTGNRALVCTDGRMAADANFAAMLDDLAAAGVETRIFDGVLPDVPVSLATDALGKVRNFAPDVVIGIGGGSCIDLAKLIALLLSHGGAPQDYYGEYMVPGPVIPVIAVPTTAGTGSEVTPVAVLSDPDRLMKVGISSPHLIPAVAICDPELTLSCPSELTAVSGADALTHAIEAYSAIRRPPTADISRNYVFVGKNDLSDYYALLAIRKISGSLRNACINGADLDARADMMLGSLVAGMAFGTAGTSFAHALQYPIGAVTHTSHGEGVAALLPYVMEFNRGVAGTHYAEIAVAMGVSSAEDADPRTLGDKAIQAVTDLFASIGIPGDLKALGLPGDKKSWVAEQCLSAQRLVANNPRPITVREAKIVVEAAFRGDRGMARCETVFEDTE
ncbi:iron-containing alcohol dehydrogenase [Pseudochelatococcus sp. B33]